MKKENDNSKIEEKGLRIVEDLLNSSNRLKTHFRREDKIPIFDGYFNFTDEKGNILKQFDVQVKSSTEIKTLLRGPNKGKTKYKFDFDVLEAVRTKVTENPTFYFVVDVNTNTVFYKLLSIDFLVELKYRDTKAKEVIYYFSESEKLRDLTSFVNNLNKIYLKCSNSIVFKTKDEIKLIQMSMNAFYKKLYDIDFIISSIWPNLWKFGLKTSASINITFKEVKTNRIVGENCSAFAIFPILYGEKDNEILEYSDSPNNLFVAFDYTGNSSPEKYLNGCLNKIIHYYINESIGYIGLMPTICLNEIVFSFLDSISEFDNTLSSITDYKTFISDSIACEDAYKIIEPYCEISFEIIRNHTFNSNNKKSRFFVNAVFPNSQVSVNKKQVEKTLVAFNAINELIKRKETKINRLWKYMVTKKVASLVCYRSDLLDKEKFINSIDYYFKEIKTVISEMIENIPMKINTKIKGKYYYNIIYSNKPFPNYSIRMALKEDIPQLIFEKHNINNNEIFQFSMWSSLIEDMFEDKMPFYNTCKLVLQKIICDKVSIDEVGVIIGDRSVKMPIN